jgi:hypothetical protein
VLAEACLRAAEGETDAADAAFGRARAAFEAQRQAGDAADALHQWGRALARAGAGPEAAERLEQAAELLRRHGAGAPWLARVEADRAAATSVRGAR